MLETCRDDFLADGSLPASSPSLMLRPCTLPASGRSSVQPRAQSQEKAYVAQGIQDGFCRGLNLLEAVGGCPGGLWVEMWGLGEIRQTEKVGFAG